MTDFLDQLKVPLVVAPMAGGPSSPELVIASSEAGALGAIGAAYSNAADIEKFVAQVRLRTIKPIAINLFAPQAPPSVTDSQITLAVTATESYRKQLGLPVPILKAPFEEDFDQQFEAVLRLRPAVFSFVFGLLAPEYIRAAKKEKMALLGTATSVEEALALQDSEVDAITLQGIEAGGHRGLFDPEGADPEVSIWQLLELCRGKVKIPLIAAGGIMSSKDIRRALSIGASAVQMGTAFLMCKEAGTSKPYRRALVGVRKTKTTRAFSGRLARGIENRFMLEMDKHPEAILPFPAQNKFTRDLRSASIKNDSSEFLSLWSGTGVGELWTGSVAELIDRLFY